MKPRHYAGMLGLVLAASAASVAAADSTATITQSDGTSVVRRVFRSPDSQTIVQQHGGSRAVITQRSSRRQARPVVDADGPDLRVALAPEDRRELQALAREEGTSVEALVEEAVQDFLDRNR